MSPTNLRKYQVDAALALQAYAAAGERELLLESPVGSGKTTTVKALAASLLKSGACRLVAVLVPQILLRGQWKVAGRWKIGRSTYALPEAAEITEVTKLTPDFWRTARGVVVVTRQAVTTPKARAVLAKLKRCLDDVLIVADEGHHCSDGNLAGKTLEVLRSKGAATLLVSATPFATAGNVGGPNCKAYRFPEYEYVMSFADDDPARPPEKFVIDRVFVGAPVSDAEATIDRSGQKGRKAEPKDDRSAEMIKAMAKRWKADGFPCAIFNIPRQAWAQPLAEALRKVKPRANLLNLVGDEIDDDAKERLAEDSKATRWADVKISAVLSCARMDEGVDWVPCSHIYNVGIPASPTLILQRWGRAARAKLKIEGYPEKWADARTLVFFTPPGTGEGESWRRQLETSWLLGGFLADYNAVRAWIQERAAQGITTKPPVPDLTPEIREWIGRLAAEVNRHGDEMSIDAARLWLVKKHLTVEVVDAVLKRSQMLRKEYRDAVTTQGLQVKGERRTEAHAAIEAALNLPIQSAPALGWAVTMTALDLKTIREQQTTHRSPDESARLIVTWSKAHDGRWPNKNSANAEERRLGGIRGHLYQDHRDVCKRQGIPCVTNTEYLDALALEVRAFLDTHKRRPQIKSEDLEERRLGRAHANLRFNHPDLCTRSGIAWQADLSAAARKRHGLEQFATLSLLVPRFCRNFRANQRTPDIEGEKGNCLNQALRSAPPRSRGLGYAPDLCQVNSLARINDEIEADCWALWLDGATAPDPRPWADILASGDHKRIVKAERIAFLDWTNPGKDGKPVRHPWKAPKVSASP